MTRLQLKALKHVLEVTGDARNMLFKAPVDPADVARAGTHSNQVYEKLGEADAWLQSLINDENARK